MRDDQHGAPVLAQRVLQPLGRGEIEVVGGLVQQEQVGLGQQDARQAQAGLFAAGEQPRGHLLALLREAQADQRALYAAGPLVAALALEALGQAGVVLGQARHGLGIGVLLSHVALHLAQALLHALQRLEHARQLVPDVQVAVDVRLLG